MKENISNTLIESYIKKYSKEDFKFILSLFPHGKLVEPIKKHNKEFCKDIRIRGFRPDSLSIEKLKDIYYTRIYNDKDQILAVNVKILVNQYLRDIDKKILEVTGSSKIVYTKIKENDMEFFDKLVNVLLETKYKKSISLYFKMKEYELSDEQNKYLYNNLENKIKVKKIELEIKHKLDEIYEKKICEVEKNYSVILSNKEQQIEFLNQKIKDNEKYFEFELANKESTIDALDERYNKTYSELLSNEKKYKDKLNDFELSLDSLKNENLDKDNEIKLLSKLLDEKYTEFDNYANEKWTENNKKLLQQSEEIKNSIESLKINKSEILKEIKALKLNECNLQSKIASIEDRAWDFLNNIRDIFNVIGLGQESISNRSNLNIVSSNVVLETEIEQINDKEYFIEDLATNLGISGICNEYTSDLAQYIYATFANKMSLLLIGYNSRKIADSIAYITHGVGTDIITLPLGYNDYNELIWTVNNSKNKVILIENAVDNISENVYIPLIKQNTDKLLVFSMESSESINLISKSILNYMMIVDIDILLGYEVNDEMLRGIIDSKIFDVNVDIKSKNNNLRYVNQLGNIIKLSNSHKFKLAEIMSIVDYLKSDNAMYDIILFTIILLCRSSHKIDELKKFIEQEDFNQITSKILQSVLGDDFSGE